MGLWMGRAYRHRLEEMRRDSACDRMKVSNHMMVCRRTKALVKNMPVESLMHGLALIHMKMCHNLVAQRVVILQENNQGVTNNLVGLDHMTVASYCMKTS